LATLQPFFFMHPKSYFFTFVCRRAIKSLETRIQLAELHAPLGGHLISWQQKYLKLIIPILTGHFGIQFGILRAYLGELCDNNKLTAVCVERILKRWDQWSWVLPFAAGPDLLFMQFRPFFFCFCCLVLR